MSGWRPNVGDSVQARSIDGYLDPSRNVMGKRGIVVRDYFPGYEVIFRTGLGEWTTVSLYLPQLEPATE